MKIYYQTTPATCGPSATMIVLQALGDKRLFSKTWEESIAAETTSTKNTRHSSLPLLGEYIAREGYTVELHHQPLEEILTHFRKGTATYWKIRKRLRHYQIEEEKAKGVQVITTTDLETIRQALRKGKKIIARTTLNGTGHMQVIDKILRKQFIIYCPIQGKYKISQEEYYKTMNSQTGRSFLVIG